MTDTASRIKKEAAAIAARPYARELTKNEDGTCFARIVEFPGCMTEGKTSEDASANLEDAMIGWIEICLEDNEVIPSPKAPRDPKDV